MTVGDVSKVLNISIRTLHYYDEIGLVKPASVRDNKHRVYSRDDIKRLQEIIIFKAIGMSLKGIGKVYNDPLYDSDVVMKSQKQMLMLKRNKLDHLIDQMDQLEKGTLETMDLCESEWELSWDEIYDYQGEVQKEVLSSVKEYVDILKTKNHKKIVGQLLNII